MPTLESMKLLHIDSAPCGETLVVGRLLPPSLAGSDRPTLTLNLPIATWVNHFYRIYRWRDCRVIIHFVRRPPVRVRRRKE
jgi:hypothetical protein